MLHESSNRNSGEGGSNRPPVWNYFPGPLGHGWTVSSLSDSGPGSLRASIAGSSSGDAINFNLGELFHYPAAN